MQLSGSSVLLRFDQIPKLMCKSIIQDLIISVLRMFKGCCLIRQNTRKQGWVYRVLLGGDASWGHVWNGTVETSTVDPWKKIVKIKI